MMKTNCDESEKKKSAGKLSINFLSREGKKHVGLVRCESEAMGPCLVRLKVTGKK